MTCVASESPGQEQRCPRCKQDPAYAELPEEPWRMGIHGHKYVPSGRGQVAGTAIGELKVPMEDLTVQTTDEEAQKRG